VPWPPRSPTLHAAGGMVCSVDHVASSAGAAILRAGGSAADAAIATSAVLAVTTQHMCGMGGDLFALVHRPGEPPDALCAAGRAGSGSDAAELRSEGRRTMPFRSDPRTAPVPGCVDGWCALHARHGRLPLAEVLEPARRAAADGFAAAPLLALATALVIEVTGADDFLPPGGLTAGALVRRPLVAEALEAIADGGRDAFYGGSFGAGLRALGDGLYSTADLARSQADWVQPIGLDVWGHRVWTVPPPSQGYLAPSAAWIAEGLPLPDDPGDDAWAHLLVEAARWAGHDRPAVLHDGADGGALLAPDRLLPRREAIDLDVRTAPPSPSAPGGTIYLCATDADGVGVSLIQSNAADWGCHVVVPGTGIFLHNRGIGFSLEAGHPAELQPGRRPPHTLSPLLVTRPDGALAAVLGTMGGDSQPQVLLQLLARLLHHGEAAGRAISAPRWVLARDGSGFETWTGDGPDRVELEAGAPPAWEAGLVRRGHQVRSRPPGTNVGHAHAIVVTEHGTYAGAADARAGSGAAIGV
jgi:gamma-glutamyltranspeptidase / glutathione hydrolase